MILSIAVENDLTRIRQRRIVERLIAEIVSLSRYESQVAALMDEEERAAMEFFIAGAPDDHPVIPGAGGFRKARWGRHGQGKSGGFRVIYYFIAPPGRIYMASIFAKSQKANPIGGRSECACETSGGDQERNEERFMSTKVNKRKTPIGKRTKLGIELEESAREILAHLKGESKLPMRRIVLPDDVDVETHPESNRDVTRGIRTRVLHQSQNTSGMGTRPQETGCDNPCVSGRHPKESQGGFECAPARKSVARPA